MNEDTLVDDVVIDGNSMQHEQGETAISALAGRIYDIGVTLDVIVETSDDRDAVINDLLQRVSGLEQAAAARPAS